MVAVPDNADKKSITDEHIAKKAHPGNDKIDRNAAAGSEKSLGAQAQSVRDSRPSTGDEVVEAIDEVTPDLNNPLVITKTSK